MKYLKEVLLLVSFFTAFTLSAQQFGTKVSPHYVFPEFTKGVVKLKDGKNIESKLNYNMITEEMLFDNEGKILALTGASLTNLDTVVIQDRRFIREGGVFYEVLYEKDYKLLIFYGCQVSAAAATGAYGSKSKVASVNTYKRFFGNDGSVYASELPDEYELTKKYVYTLRKGGEEKKFHSLSHIKKNYKAQKSEYKSYVKKHKPKFENPFEISGLIQHLEK